jgi:TetR/AcrR family transcriptional repressor of bet genes
MSRPSNTDERRDQITGALIKVMASRGYDGASINEIAKAAGLTSGLVHYHFKNKQQILLAALSELVARHERRLDEALTSASSSAAAQVATFIDLHLGLGANAAPDELACWILISGEALRQPAVQRDFTDALAGLTKRLESIIDAGCGSGSFARANASEAAAAIVATIQGYFVLAAVSPALIPRGSAYRSTLRMAEGLLGAPLEAGRDGGPL